MPVMCGKELYSFNFHCEITRQRQRQQVAEVRIGEAGYWAFTCAEKRLPDFAAQMGGFEALQRQWNDGLRQRWLGKCESIFAHDNLQC